MKIDAEHRKYLIELLEYTLEFEKEHFEHMLEENMPCCEPIDGVDPEVWEAKVDKYFEQIREEDHCDEELFDEIAMISKGSYGNALRLWEKYIQV